MKHGEITIGKIYKIVCDTTGQIYIGATTTTLDKRLKGHELAYRYKQEGKKIANMSSFEILANNNYHIEQIETMNIIGYDKLQLHKLENKWIQATKCVNILKGTYEAKEPKYRQRQRTQQLINSSTLQYGRHQLVNAQYKACNEPHVNIRYVCVVYSC